jgi:hypothetical protein
MLILAQGGQTYSRLQFTAGPGGALELPVTIDYSQPFAAANWETWEAEYQQAVQVLPEPTSGLTGEPDPRQSLWGPAPREHTDRWLPEHDDFSAWLIQ